MISGDGLGFESAAIDIHPGNLLAIVTDGLMEAANQSGNEAHRNHWMPAEITGSS